MITWWGGADTTKTMLATSNYGKVCNYPIRKETTQSLIHLFFIYCIKPNITNKLLDNEYVRRGGGLMSIEKQETTI